MYIVVEGAIGAGKTSLTNLISDTFGHKSVYEIVGENPFLEKFYDDVDKWAFQTEMYFLTHRYNQLTNIKKKYIDQNKSIVADYDIHKNLIFAEKNLTLEQNEKFKQIFNILTSDIPKADLFIFINVPVEILRERITRRGRDFEQNIDTEYLNYLIDAYVNYITYLEVTFSNILVIDGKQHDFVNDLTSREIVAKMIEQKISEITSHSQKISEITTTHES